jgi:hypothetical protein
MLENGEVSNSLRGSGQSTAAADGGEATYGQTRRLNSQNQRREAAIRGLR